MPTPPLTLEKIMPTLRSVSALLATGDYYLEEKQDGKASAIEEASRLIGVPHSTIRHHCKSASLWGVDIGAIHHDTKPSDVELENLPDGLEVLERLAPANDSYIKKARAGKWRLIPVRQEPFMVAFFGDPHIDNKGADLHGLKQDIDIARSVGARCVNLGDALDNFHMTGKLARKQAANRMTIKEGLAVARWLTRDSGVKWDAHILGNHDQWGEDAYAQLMAGWAREAGSRFYDWEVYLRYQWDGGGFTVLAAHDFKGHSIHNGLHGNMRRSVEDGTADLYVAGHRHTAGEGASENGWRGRKYWSLRVKGYKAWDEYANAKQFQQQQEGASGAAVINPLATTLDDQCRLFSSVEGGAEYLTHLRARAIGD